MENELDKTVRAKIIERITAAFNGVSRGEVSLHQANVIGYNCTPDLYRDAGKKDNETRWQDVSEDAIAEIHNFVYLDEDGIKYYLAAYMVWILKHYETGYFTPYFIIYFLTLEKKNVEENAKKRADFSQFTREQSKAVYLFLRHFADAGVSEQWRNTDIWWEAEYAIDSYWQEFENEL